MANDDDEKPRPPHLRLAVENNDHTVARKRAEAQLERPLKQLASNLLRVVRGAGRPEEIVTNCFEVVEVFKNFREVVGYWPDNVGMTLHLPRMTTGHYDEHEAAINVMVDGALQVAASRLIGQLTQETRGKHELLEGFRMLLSERERERAKTRAKWKPQKPKRRSEPEESFDLGPAPKQKKARDKTSTEFEAKPEPPPNPKATPPEIKPDRKTPPDYDRCGRYTMTEDEKAEFRVNNIDDLVAIANAYLIAAGRWPLTQADFPGNKSGFIKVAKMIRAFREKGK